MLCGSALGLLMSCAIRMLFPPAGDQLQGVNAPVYWLERSGRGEQDAIPRNLIRILKVLAAVAVVAAIGTLLAGRT